MRRVAKWRCLLRHRNSHDADGQQCHRLWSLCHSGRCHSRRVWTPESSGTEWERSAATTITSSGTVSQHCKAGSTPPTWAGNVAFTSDYRTKKDIEPLPSMMGHDQGAEADQVHAESFLAAVPCVALVAERGCRSVHRRQHRAVGFSRPQRIVQETMVDSGGLRAEGCKTWTRSSHQNPWTVIAALTRAPCRKR